MFSKVLNIGITDRLEFYQKRETKILNLFSLITLTGLLIGTTNIFFLKDHYPVFMVSFEALASFAVLILNHKQIYQASAYVFVISINFTLLYMNLYYHNDTGSYLYYFPLIFCIALLHNPNKSKARAIAFFCIILVSFFGARFLDSSLIQAAKLNDEQNKIIFNYNVNLVAVLTVILVYLVITFINKQYKELSDLLVTSKDDQITIENSLKEKEVLLAEIQHRVKNNLSVIIGLFNLQKDSATNEETKQSITEAKNRVLSIAMVHERLYRKDDLSKINLKYYISELTKEIVRGHHLYKTVTIEESLEDINADITKAVPIGLIVNEVVTNSLKHAFKDTDTKPVLKLSLSRNFDQICIKVEDNGKGFPENKVRSDRSLGLTLIESLANQIDGNIYYLNNNGAGVKLSFQF
jgi:two-component sensor histidine kinase